MKKLRIYSLLVGLGTALYATAAHAQILVPGAGIEFEMPQFWIAVISGIVLAVGLQAVLMAVSVATGLSLTPDLKKASAKRKAQNMSREDRRYLFDEDEAHEEEEDHKGHSSISMTVANSFGIWATVTTSIALFLASFLAVKLGMIAFDAQGVIVGLVIWAAFFVIMAYLEWKSVQSLMGGMFHLARAGFSAGGDMISSVFGKSPEHRAEDMGRRTVRAIYEEMAEISHKDKLDKKLKKYVEKLAPKQPDYHKIHDEIVDILKQIKVEEDIEVNEEDVTRILSLKLEKDHKVMNRDNAAKLTDTVRKAARKAKGQPDRAEGMLAAAETLAPLSDEDAHAFRVKLEESLRRTGREELNPDELHRDLESIFNDPKSTLEIVRARLAMMDRDSIKAILAEYKDMDRARADKLVDNTMKVIDKLRGKYGTSEVHEEAYDSYAAEAYADDYTGGRAVSRRKLPARVEEKIAHYFDSLGRSELDYDEIRADFEEIMHDPKVAPRVLKSRLSQLDRNTLEALLASNRHISDEQAHKIAEQIMGAKDNVSTTIEKVQDKALVQYEKTRRRAILMAEHAREAAMAAAWWIVIAAVISALAASVGGWLATTTV